MFTLINVLYLSVLVMGYSHNRALYKCSITLILTLIQIDTGLSEISISVLAHHCKNVEYITQYPSCPSVIMPMLWWVRLVACLLWQPLILRPTSCWKIDWDELETNQQNFRALSSLLSQQVHTVSRRFLSLLIFSFPYSKTVVIILSVASVCCLSLCRFRALTFECLDLQTSFLLHKYNFMTCRSRSSI